jgi:2-dehydro-3-deoxy-D-arabinonate dehydratase
VLEHQGRFFPLRDGEGWDWLVNHDELFPFLRRVTETRASVSRLEADVLAPIESQEVWAAGVTYLRSRTARIEESQAAGGGSFYDAVYQAERPELFFKASPWRVCGPSQAVRIRGDAQWSVPEPELALCINSRGEVVGYTIGNDMSSRDIEGENPLYLPQAKIYDGSCALGPALLVRDAPLPAETSIELTIRRAGAVVFAGNTTLSQMRRTPGELVEFLYRETSFPKGCVLLTGTGVVPPDDFTLQQGDEVAIEIQPIGTLVNRVA